jgi:hypothetical protein
MRVASPKQYDWDYWQAHKGIAGGSDAEHVCTPAKGDYPKSAQTLIAKLIADQYDPGYGMHDEASTVAMRNGLLHEPCARKSLEFELGEPITEVGFCVTDDGRFGCSPDGLLGEKRGCELKVPAHKTHVIYLLNPDKLLAEYKAQAHWSLIVTGRDVWMIVSWNFYLPPVFIEVAPDDYTEKMRANMELFWSDYQKAIAIVNEKFPPPPPPVVADYGIFGTVENPELVSPF